MEGTAIPQDTLLKVNGLGLINTVRPTGDDSYVYFGSAKEMNG